MEKAFTPIQLILMAIHKSGTTVRLADAVIMTVIATTGTGRQVRSSFEYIRGSLNLENSLKRVDEK